MFESLLRRRGRFLRGIVLLLVFCAPAEMVSAQRIGGGGGGRGPDWGETPDPNDPNRIAAAARKKAQKYFDDGLKLLAKGRIQRAKGKFKAVIGIVGAEGVGQAAFAELQGIHRRGMDELNRAQELYGEAKYREALDIAKKTKILYANIFGGIEGAPPRPKIALLATQLIKIIDKNPDAQIQIREYAAAKRAKRIPTLEKRAKKDPTRYYDLYKVHKAIAKRFPNCPTGMNSAEAVDKLRADKKIWKHIKREKKRRYIASILQSVEQLEKAGLTAEAAAEYKRLTKKFPGKSRQELRRMAAKQGVARE